MAGEQVDERREDQPPVVASVDLDQGKPPSEVQPPETKPYDPEPHRDRMRGVLALVLLGTLAGTVVFSFVVILWKPDRSKDVHDLLGIVFSPLVALVGAATGYYFGSRDQGPRQQQ
jgi:hypothetical protein